MAVMMVRMMAVADMVVGGGDVKDSGYGSDHGEMMENVVVVVAVATLVTIVVAYMLLFLIKSLTSFYNISFIFFYSENNF